MGIPFAEQYYVEKARNDKFEGLIFFVAAISLIIYGLIFHWLPVFLRRKQKNGKLKYNWAFKAINKWEILTGCIGIDLPFLKKKFYFQPSLILLFLTFLTINFAFCYVETRDIDYEPWFYIIGKRIGRVAVGNLPMLNIFILKNDLVTSITGLQHDRIEVMHHWMGRLIWVMITIHMSLTITYWVGLDFQVMIFIPPQIFGMIAYSTMFLLTWASMRFIRKWSYDFFIIQHKVLAIIMLLFAFFHNPASKAAVLIAVHIVVLDRVLSRIIGFIHKRTGPTKGLSEFKFIDEETIEVAIELKSIVNRNAWYYNFLPKIGTWNPGQHIYLNVGKVSKFQYHPFTISSTPDSGIIKLLIRKQKGFTKQLMKKIKQEMINEESHSQSIFLKALIYGPYGGKLHLLIHFDSLLFLSAGSGSSYTFPLALNLLQKLDERNNLQDFLFRPQTSRIKIVWIIRNIENMNWYKDILKELSNYVNQGNVRIDIFVTEPLPGKLICMDQKDQESAKTDFPKERIEDLGDSTNSSFSSSSHETTAFNLSEIELHYCRPKVMSLVDHTVDNIITDSNSSYKSLAVIGCGPGRFTSELKEACQKNRWRKDSPDIYCHTESYS